MWFLETLDKLRDNPRTEEVVLRVIGTLKKKKGLGIWLKW
jgi:hypothetical protein